jgi:dihydroxyacid dehydratase/phosphogluconate dehydratase
VLAAAVRRGVQAAGGLPLEFPVMSLSEDLMKPTAMLYRNLLAIEVEETIRSQPLDGIVALGNCDKTVPAYLMALASADIPALIVTGGFRAVPLFRGERLGSGTALWRLYDARRAGALGAAEWARLETCLGRGLGACNTMGTASTMAIMAETLGLTMPGSAVLAAGDATQVSLAEEAGRRIVSAVAGEVRPSSFLTAAGFENAMTVLAALAGGPARWPLVPSGVTSLPAFMVVRGNLAPDGAVIKAAAASPALLRHRGPAVVFHSYQEMRARVDDPALDVTADSVLVLAGCGPAGMAMPEWGNIPIPAKLLSQGVTDMLRITDGRMSGTGFGTVVLHVAPESAVGGPLSRLRDGDVVSLDAYAGSLSISADLDAREPILPAIGDTRGWPVLHRMHVLQAPEGCDYDFLAARTPDQLTFMEPVIGRS